MDALVGKLTELRQNLLNTSKEVPTGLVDEFDHALTKKVNTPNSYSAISNTRSTVGDMLTKYYKGANNGILGEQGANEIQAVKEALGNSLSDAAQHSGNPELAFADTEARSFYDKLSKQFRHPDIVAAKTSADPDVVMKGMMAAGEGQSKRLFESLEPKGRLAFMANFTDEILKKTEGNPQKFVDALKGKADSYGVFFKGEDAARVNGIKKLLEHINTGSSFVGPTAGAVGAGLTSGMTAGNPVITGAATILGGMAGSGVSDRFGGSEKLGGLVKTVLTSEGSAKFLEALARMPQGKAGQFIDRNLPRIIAANAGQKVSSAIEKTFRDEAEAKKVPAGPPASMNVQGAP